ncbi:RNA exonuclease-like protein [Hapsidospora chrysogenum ATCC 11550]|uniref:RNA exonuclease 4 n=1 Tax=Hapsidospora chrysogenum (strain ATCC 11550 / CBS 779.69 / DSM 880 / IAM 14645 / JCM 23072 / IMI 49137) TaxID=857340 RepID=A0A086SYA1_HAPC1|nr:RNA exonuclease-like protein [Hapsidospora chrysogenum ATCC 11550]
MAELSSNWKKLQAKLKAESGSTTSLKRKSELLPEPRQKKPKTSDRPSKKASLDSKSKAAPPSRRTMGGVQSTKIEHQPKHGVSPSLALWAADNDISAESLAEAYNLGTKDPSLTLASAKDKINHGLTEGLEVGKYVAIDCEMVGVGPGGYESALARVSIVDFHGNQVYDSYVKPKERVTDWRTAVSGVSIKQMRFAREFEEVQEEVARILEGRILVGHDLKHDLDALKLSHPFRDTRDTAKYHSFKKYGNGRKPALRTLAQEILGVEIQGGAHSSIEDARVTMLLFRKHKSGFDVDHANRYAPTQQNGQGGSKGKKFKKKRKT